MSRLMLITSALNVGKTFSQPRVTFSMIYQRVLSYYLRNLSLVNMPLPHDLSGL